jgi:hypothetical protein
MNDQLTIRPLKGLLIFILPVFALLTLNQEKYTKTDRNVAFGYWAFRIATSYMLLRRHSEQASMGASQRGLLLQAVKHSVIPNR